MFNEKTVEKINGMELPVFQMPKYKESKEIAIKFINDKKIVNEGDFWILMNKNKTKDKMLYSGLIISHNGCLKINDNLPDKDKFKPSCVSVEKNGYNNSLVYTYCNDEQGIYEVGEVSPSNYKNDSAEYPYAMAFKRCFDRVVLKNCKLAYAGIYSDSEAEEFKQKEETNKIEQKIEIIGGEFILNGGKYDGKTINEVIDCDLDYIYYCLKNGKNQNVLANMQKALNDKKITPPEENL